MNSAKRVFAASFMLMACGSHASSTVIINTDSRVHGSIGEAGYGQASEPAHAQPQTLEQEVPPWLLPGGSSKNQQEHAIASRMLASNAEPAYQKEARPAPLPQGGPPKVESARWEDAERSEPTKAVATQGDDDNSLEKKDFSPAPISAPLKQWTLKPGSLYEQVVEWGSEDPMWDVIWAATEDVEVEVPFTFTGELDEAVITIVKAFARQGVAIRVLRAKANKQLVIKGE